MPRHVDAVRFGNLVRASLDEPVSTGALARQAAHSRSGFFRLFQALLEESPGAMRRRFLLERAAWELGRTRKSVTDIAFDAGYQSLEAFSRAFTKAYRVSPSLYRRTRAWSIYLPAPNEFHFVPARLERAAAGPREPDPDHTRHLHRGDNMDLFDLFQGTDAWYTRRLLESASTLNEAQLDQAIPATAAVFAWDKPDQNLREILERMVLTKEVWVAALTSGPMPPLENPTAEQRTPQALLERATRADEAFRRALTEIRDRNAWDETFVDALCEPPESFTFGGMFAHVMTFNAQRRLNAIDVLRRLGVAVEGVGCPMDYEASQKQATRT